MLMTSTNKMEFGSNGASIYTRKRQIEYHSHLQTDNTEHKISQKSLYIMVMLVILLLFCTWFGMVFFKSVISQVQMDINAINSDVRLIEQDNSRLEAEKIGALDIESIQISAQKIGMSLPNAYQIEYVDTVGDDATNLSNIDID